MRTHALALCAGLLCLAVPAPAQDTISPGYAQTGQQPIPAPFASYATLASGDRVVFDGNTVDLYDGANGFLMNLGTMPSFVFNSFVVVDPTESFAVIGESSNGDLFTVALDGSGMSLLANVPLNYAAAFEGAGAVMVSAADTGGGNDIVRVDVGTGNVGDVAHVPGASGPVAFTASGDLLYGTISDVFPAPPGSSDVLWWSQAQITSGAMLTELDASVLHGGLDGAASLAVDPVLGSVLVAESVFGATSRILELDATGALVGTVVESTGFLSSIELHQGGGVGHFRRYQPSDGVFMTYSNGVIVTVAPQRPVASFQQVGMIGTVTITGAHPSSAFLLVWGPQSLWSPSETSYLLSFDFLFHTGLPLGSLNRLGFRIPTDASGTGTFTYFDPGGLAGNRAFQALVTDESGGFIGSSTSVLN